MADNFVGWPDVVNDDGSLTTGTPFSEQYDDAVRAAVADNLYSATNPTIKTKTIIDEVVAARDGEVSLLAKVNAIEAAIAASTAADDARLDTLEDISVTRVTVSTAGVGNVGAGEDNLVSFSVPANTLAANGEALEFDAWGVTANNANVKTLRVYFGATAFYQGALTASSAGFWHVHGHIVRTGAATQIARAQVTHTLTAPTSPIGGASPAETLSGAVNLRITGEATADNDITIAIFIVKKIG